LWGSSSVIATGVFLSPPTSVSKKTLYNQRGLDDTHTRIRKEMGETKKIK
jgi:hypothetical protein